MSTNQVGNEQGSGHSSPLEYNGGHKSSTASHNSQKPHNTWTEIEALSAMRVRGNVINGLQSARTEATEGHINPRGVAQNGEAASTCLLMHAPFRTSTSLQKGISQKARLEGLQAILCN